MVKPTDQVFLNIESSASNTQGVIPQDAETTLDSIYPMMQHIARWLIHSGVGYTDFVAALKPIFYEQALVELERIKQNKTDSAVSLLSGLHRKDVSAFRQQANQINNEAPNFAISVPARVIARWIALDLPHQIPVSGEENSFEALVKHISTEKHPRSILFELQRLGVVVQIDQEVVLQQHSFTPDNQMQESKALFSANLSDHLAAGIDNFISEKPFTHLEQAVHAEKLTADSVEALRKLSIELWQDMAKQLLNAAIQHCDQDQEKDDAHYQFRFGVYQYDTQIKLQVPYIFKDK
ncbi:hypothetical protein F993_02948 [Acinetobacter proteolyticus]|jgi:hypothetical protein|uniref:Uncharacterized protein n=1 Tax=Acinetobacter proteolyticus TaxID=1776741 RepID=A0A653K5U0_9GAMM|nr:DUF6502 family protein [Acinetobacter proteolyticus]QHH93165.1 hypothetical protein FPL18_04570 [Acinetobacter gyllenbergii]ENU22494.1 hypothetical protein F993_02948 [Acinetobacter proteolyticus]OEY92595.1 hypothetical protein BJD20_07025 [Acinetobacter proteolyticus]PKF31185.1 hypothetical protein CW311_20100 [Acinetobacter proteolyticus]VXA56221.1 conserved hypothetical protein [Acinetobacter proteolyticus]